MRTTAWCTVVASLAFGAAAQAGVASVWAVADGDKIARDDVASPLRTGNSAWDGRVVRLFGARNEVLAFQVVVEADAKGIGALRLSLPELRQHAGASRIVYAPPATDPTQYVGRPIQVFCRSVCTEDPRHERRSDGQI